MNNRIPRHNPRKHLPSHQPHHNRPHHASTRTDNTHYQIRQLKMSIMHNRQSSYPYHQQSKPARPPKYPYLKASPKSDHNIPNIAKPAQTKSKGGPKPQTPPTQATRSDPTSQTLITTTTQSIAYDLIGALSAEFHAILKLAPDATPVPTLSQPHRVDSDASHSQKIDYNDIIQAPPDPTGRTIDHSTDPPRGATSPYTARQVTTDATRNTSILAA